MTMVPRRKMTFEEKTWVAYLRALLREQPDSLCISMDHEGYILIWCFDKYMGLTNEKFDHNREPNPNNMNYVGGDLCEIEPKNLAPAVW